MAQQTQPRPRQRHSTALRWDSQPPGSQREEGQPLSPWELPDTEWPVAPTGARRVSSKGSLVSLAHVLSPQGQPLAGGGVQALRCPPAD